MRALKTTTTPLISALALAARSLPIPDYGGSGSLAAQVLVEVSQAQVRGLVNKVCRDAEHVNLIFANNPNVERQRPYQKEFSKGRVTFSKGDYGGAAGHLCRADEVIRSFTWLEQRCARERHFSRR